MTRPTAKRVAAAAALAALGASGLAACSNSDALTLVRQACGHVQRSITLYRASQTATTPADQRAKANAAFSELRVALPLAATAAGESAQWQAFMITLTQSSRVPESVIVPALEQQCADVRAGGQPVGPPTSSGPTTLPTNPAPVGR